MKHKPYMLDTNICSFIMRQSPPSVLAALSEAIAQSRKCVISAISYMELRRGASKPNASPKLHRRVDAFIRCVDILPFDKAAADASAKVYGQLATKGELIGGNDIAIAGHCLATDCILVTNNTREFGRVEGLGIEDWAAASRKQT